MSPTATTALIDRKLTNIPQGQLNRRNRVEYFEQFKQLPLLNASVLITDTAPTLAQMALRFRANRDWEIRGVNAADADQTFSPSGGMLIKTAATANDHTYTSPHADTLQSAVAASGLFGTENQVRYEAEISVASIATMMVRHGLFEDINQPADPATVGSDDNAAFFIFDEDNATSATQFVCVTNVGGVDTFTASGVPIVINTEYQLRVEIDANRQPHFYINGRQVAVGPVMTDAVDLLPQTLIGTDTAAAKTMIIRHLRISRGV